MQILFIFVVRLWTVYLTSNSIINFYTAKDTAALFCHYQCRQLIPALPDITYFLCVYLTNVSYWPVYYSTYSTIALALRNEPPAAKKNTVALFFLDAEFIYLCCTGHDNENEKRFLVVSVRHIVLSHLHAHSGAELNKKWITITSSSQLRGCWLPLSPVHMRVHLRSRLVDHCNVLCCG